MIEIIKQNSIFIKNNNIAPRYLLNINIQPGATQYYSKFAFNSILRDPTIVDDVLLGTLIINDGEKDLSPQDAIKYLTFPPPMVEQLADVTTQSSVSPTSDPIEVSENTFIRRNGAWVIGTPKSSPQSFGNVVEITNNYSITLANRNDIIVYKGDGDHTVFLPPVSDSVSTDTFFNVNVRNASTGLLYFAAAPAARFVGFGKSIVFVETPVPSTIEIKPGSEVIFGVKGNDWSIISETASTNARLAALENPPGVLNFGYVSIAKSLSSTIDLTLGNVWKVLADQSGVLLIDVPTGTELTEYLTFDLTILQNTVGNFNITFQNNVGTNENIRWNNNKVVNPEKKANAITVYRFTSFDFGNTFYAVNLLKWSF